MQCRDAFEVPGSFCLRNGSANPGYLLIAADQIFDSALR